VIPVRAKKEEHGRLRVSVATYRAWLFLLPYPGFRTWVVKVTGRGLQVEIAKIAVIAKIG
jgi:hypothetical protein